MFKNMFKTCRKLLSFEHLSTIILKTKKYFSKNVKTCAKLLTFEHVFYIVLNMRKFSENFVIFETLQFNKYVEIYYFKIEKRYKSFVF